MLENVGLKGPHEPAFAAAMPARRVARTMQVLGACILLAAGARAPAVAAGPGAAVVEILEPQGGGTVHEVCSETGQAPISVRFRVASAVAAAAAVDALAITVLVDGNEHSSITVAEDERVRAW